LFVIDSLPLMDRYFCWVGIFVNNHLTIFFGQSWCTGA